LKEKRIAATVGVLTQFRTLEKKTTPQKLKWTAVVFWLSHVRLFAVHVQETTDLHLETPIGGHESMCENIELI